MSMMNELDYRLSLVQSGILLHEGSESAMNARIDEWFDTPACTLADNVRWGHPLRQYQFDPPSDLLAIEMEMVVAQKITQDIEGIIVRYIRIDVTGVDSITVMIAHNYGVFGGTLPYREGENGRA
ncbi:MAG: hypothetical protein IBX50_14525 [Marinospirillum sp.]|uniref:hypothetical protein n=1 Tax=Marinospirillum sp. TaxID=2183934 RepID=UPI0019F57F29|nr:hypothetical protein [Marinospirillum sp.]MBE0507903.1 hypothetical protein [Marinospirillum sp.]